MKHKTTELTGDLLDDAVFRAEGLAQTRKTIITFTNFGSGGSGRASSNVPAYSTDWSAGGPIIERERINLAGRTRNGRPSGEWCADTGKLPLHFGPTPLIAAMRAYVASKLGDEVDV